MKETTLYNMFIGRKTMLRIFLCLFSIISIGLFVKYDYFLYDTPIATIISVKQNKAFVESGYEGKYKETYYRQILIGKIKNGKHSGKTVKLKNEYSKSTVYDTKYSVGDDVFIERIRAKGGSLKGVITGMKRDSIVIIALTTLFLLFIMIGGKEGLLTIISLALNLIAFYYMLTLYFKGINILFMSIILVAIFTAMILLFLYGKSELTHLSLLSTLLAVLISGIIAIIVIKVSSRIDFDFMEYLIHPYDQRDATLIFISEFLIGSMGAVMDVVVTVIITISQIVKTGNPTSHRMLFKACRSVGDAVVGTMIPTMFFTNIAADIPFFILSMRNGISMGSILRYNSFFASARFLIGSIAIVISVPIATYISSIYYRKRFTKC